MSEKKNGFWKNWRRRSVFLAMIITLPLVVWLVPYLTKTEHERAIDFFKPIWEARVEKGIIDKGIYDEYFIYLTNTAPFDPRFYDRIGLTNEREKNLIVLRGCNDISSPLEKKYCHYEAAISYEKGRALTPSEECTIGMFLYDMAYGLEELTLAFREEQTSAACGVPVKKDANK